ncbi:MAG: MoxR family ATPase [Planctomycetota bacterium]|nr:MAG: MoxR family ATPase [Planctomycetota bacterium]
MIRLPQGRKHVSDLVSRLRDNLGRAIRGKEREIDLLVACFLGGGNVLLNDVPGVGKTTLAKAIAKSIAGGFRRVQFTPDLLPADILGGSIYNPKEGSFSFRKGPVFTNVLLADEINRASPRTQSALLEAMAEGQVSIEGTTHALPDPFWVIATQNPVESHGTYPLPEAQLDRFSMQLAMGYPPPEEEEKILADLGGPSPLAGLDAVTTLEEVVAERARVQSLHVDEDVRRYIVDIVRATRREPRLALGASPRGGIALYRMAQGWAAVQGREAVLPDDVKAVAGKTLAHRLVLETKARYSGVDKEALVADVLEGVRVPV